MKLEEVVGINVARLREQRRLPQAELGELLGQYLGKPWTRQAVSAAEKGRRAFAVAELVALAAALKSDVSELLAVHLALPEGVVELPAKAISTDAYRALVEPEDVDDALRTMDLRSIRSLVPMLKEANAMTQLLYVSLRDIFLGDEARAADAAQDMANADVLLGLRELMQTVQEGKRAAGEFGERLNGPQDEG